LSKQSILVPDYFISTNAALLDHDFIVRSLATTYWATGRPREMIEKSIAASLCFGAYVADTKEQVGFARVVTDRATFAWICDVFVANSHRGRGLGKRLMEEVVSHPDLATTKMYLGTKDAHGLYERFGFVNWQLMRHDPQTSPNKAAETSGRPSSAER
jgi:GNAT superfamily N-acetyltransferase